MRKEKLRKMGHMGFAWVVAVGIGAQVHAQEIGLSWEGEVELGFESVLNSTVASREQDAAFAFGELAAKYGFGNGFAIFGALTLEEVENSAGDTGYGIYVGSLGVELSFGNTTFEIGKSAPAFGAAWDEAGGYFASVLAEDYELAEQIGVFAEIETANAGNFSFGAFYADNSALSKSAGFNRGRISTADGSAGNTGKINNFSVQWSTEFGDSRIWAGARHLSAGTGDVSDETGAFLGFGHSFGESIDIYADMAYFDGFGGTSDDAVYVTLNGVYSLGDWAFSASYGYRDIDSLGRTDLWTLGADYEFKNGNSLGGAFAFADDAGVKDTLFGISLVIPLGG